MCGLAHESRVLDHETVDSEQAAVRIELSNCCLTTSTRGPQTAPICGRLRITGGE